MVGEPTPGPVMPYGGDVPLGASAPPGGAPVGQPYLGEGMLNLPQYGGTGYGAGNWGGSGVFYSNPQAVFSYQNQLATYLGQPASSTQYNPYTPGSAAYESYESTRRSFSQPPTATAQNQPTYNEYITSRPGFYTDVGDSQTDIIMQQQGVSELEALRQQIELAADTPGLTDDRFYQNELSKANHNLVEASSGYHAWGMDTGLPVAPNPFEYVGDLALALEKGTNGPSSAYGVSPVDLNILGLPGGQGIQDAQWNMAVAYDKNQPIPAFPDFTQAISTIDKARNTGEMGPYANLGSPTWQQWNPETQSYSTEKIPLSDQQAIGYYVGGSNPELLYSDPANMKNAVALGFGMNYNTPEKTVVNVPGLTVEKGTGNIDTFGYQKPFLSSPNGAAPSASTPETNIELPTLSPTLGFGAQAASSGAYTLEYAGGQPLPGAESSPAPFDPFAAIGGFFGGLFGGSKETPTTPSTPKESPFYTSKAAYGANLTQYNTDVNALNADVLAYKSNPAYNKYTADLALFNADVKAYEKNPTQAGYDNLVYREAGLKSTGAVFDAQYNSLNQRSTALDTRKGQLDSEFAKTESYRAGVEYKTPVGDGTYNSLTFTIKPDWKEFTSTSPPTPEKNIIDTSLDWVGGNIRAVGEVPIIGNIVDMGVAAKPVVGFVPVFGQAVKVPLELASRPGAQTQPDDMNGPRPYGEFSAWGGGAGNWLEQQGWVDAETSKVRVDISKEKMMSPDLSITDRAIAGVQLFRSGTEGIIRQYPEEILTAGEQMYLAGPAFGLAAEGTAGGGTWLATKLGASPSVVNLATKAGEYVIPAGFVGLMAGEVTKDEKGNMFSDFSAPNIVLKSGEMAPYLFSMMVGGYAETGIFGKQKITTSEYAKNDLTTVATGGMFEPGRIGIDPYQLASGGQFRSEPYMGEVIKETTITREGGIFGEGGLYSQAKGLGSSNGVITQIANFNPANVEIIRHLPEPSKPYPNRNIETPTGMKSNPEWEAQYASEHGLFGAQGPVGKLAATEIRYTNKYQANPMDIPGMELSGKPGTGTLGMEFREGAFVPTRIRLINDDVMGNPRYMNVDVWTVGENVGYPQNTPRVRDPTKLNLFEAVNAITIGTSAFTPRTYPKTSWDSRFSGGYDVNGFPIGSKSPRPIQPEYTPEYAAEGLVDFFGRPIKQPTSKTQSPKKIDYSTEGLIDYIGRPVKLNPQSTVKYAPSPQVGTVGLSGLLMTSATSQDSSYPFMGAMANNMQSNKAIVSPMDELKMFATVSEMNKAQTGEESSNSARSLTEFGVRSDTSADIAAKADTMSEVRAETDSISKIRAETDSLSKVGSKAEPASFVKSLSTPMSFSIESPSAKITTDLFAKYGVGAGAITSPSAISKPSSIVDTGVFLKTGAVPDILPIINPIVGPKPKPIVTPVPHPKPKPEPTQKPGTPTPPGGAIPFPRFPGIGGGGTDPGHRTGKSQFTEYLGYVMIGKKKVKMQPPQQKVVTRVVRVPTRQRQIYGLAAPTLPPMTQAQAPSNSQAQIVKVAMKKGFAAPNITAKPIRQARLAQPKLTRPTADPFKVRRRR